MTRRKKKKNGAGAADQRDSLDRSLRRRLEALLLAGSIALAMVIVLGISLDRWVTGEMVSQYQREQLITAKQQGARLGELFTHIERDLVLAAARPEAVALSEEAVRPLLRSLHERHSAFVTCTSFQDAEGVVRCAEGFDVSGEGQSIREQPHIRRLFDERRVVASGPFLAVEGYYAIALHAPILVDGRVKGSIGALIRWDAFTPWFEKARFSPSSAAILMDGAGTVIHCDQPSFVGRPMQELPTITLDNEPVDPPYFLGNHAVVVDGPFFHFRKQVLASASFVVGRDLYALVKFVPYDDVAGPLMHFARISGALLVAALAIVVLTVAAIVLIFYRDYRQSRRLQRDLRTEIKERRQAEAGLLEREAFNVALFLHNPLETIVVDREGCIVTSNIAQIKSAGRLPRPGDVMYRDYAAKHRVNMYAELMDCIRSGKVRDFPELRYGDRHMAVTISPFPQGAIIISKDITERKHLEQQVVQAAKMDAIGQLAGGIAHDFNNQLTGIMGFADMLQSRLADNPELRRYAEMIVQSTERAADLTKELLAFARKGKYLSTTVDIHAVIGDVVDLLNHTIDKRIRIHCELQAHPATTRGDPTQIHNALLNVALNARDAMPEGGDLTFASDLVELDAQACRRHAENPAPGRFVRVSVTDTGSGMSEETLRHCFEPFFTTKTTGHGTGMGLAAVYGTVKNHRGAVEAQSELGKGTTVRLLLPVGEKQTEPAHTAPEEPVPGSEHILVVDDEDTILKMATEILGGLGYRVSACSNGTEALAIYREQHAEIDLVILDMVMPELGGRDTFVALREIRPDVKAILSSGYTIDGEAQAILDEGVQAFVQKPFRVAELSHTVARCLRGSDIDKAGTTAAGRA